MRSVAGPTRRGIIMLLLTLWQVASSGVRVFAWESLRDGAIDMRPLSRTLRLLTVVGLAQVVGFLISILFNDLLRRAGALEPLVIESGARGLLTPGAAVPLTLAALAVGWGYVLTGALHVRSDVRWAVLLLYILFSAANLIGAISGTTSPLLFGSNVATIAITLVVLALLIICFIVLPRVRAPLALEWSLLLGLHGTLFLMALLQAAANQRFGGTLRISGLVTNLTDAALALIIPLWLIAGTEMVNFGLDASGWIVRAVQRQTAAWVGALLLVVLLVYRFYGLASASLADGIDVRRLGAWGGALLLCAGLALIARWRRRQPIGGRIGGRLIVALALLATLTLLVISALVTLLSAWVVLAGPTLDASAAFTRFTRTVVAASAQERQLRPLAIAVVGMLIAIVAGRRGHATVAAFGAILAWSQALFWLTQNGRLLAGLRYEYSDVDTIILLGLSGLALRWAAQQRLTVQRAVRLLGLATLAAVLNQTDFLDNPFSPIFGFAGIFFLVFGIAWSVITAGGRFANTESPGFPRASRLLLYLGYVLISVSVAHWYIVSHNVARQATQGTITAYGFQALGLPLAYLVFVEGGARLLSQET